MDITIIILLSILLLAVVFLLTKKKEDTDGKSQELLVQLNAELRNEIQNIRKEVSDNSEKGRKEIDSKLKDINKEINEFHKSSKTDMQQQFADSKKVIKEVTMELEKIKGTNEQVLSFANQMKTLEKILGNQDIFGRGTKLKRIPLDNSYPKYIFENKEIFLNWTI